MSLVFLILVAERFQKGCRKVTERYRKAPERFHKIPNLNYSF
jgi:hypothetical protein